MKIAELFHSIQGEGLLAGAPSVFVRTSGCNLRCVWCDTPYTSWAPEGRGMTVEEIVAAVEAYSSRHVVLTGGEPMIAPEIAALTRRLREAGRHITVETAGTVFAPVECDLMSLSPKLSNSTPTDLEGGRWAERHEKLRIQTGVLRRLMEDYEHQLKFVVADPGDLDEVRALVRELDADSGRVLLMPEGRTPEILRERGAWLAETCVQEGFRYCPRLHVELWGGRRGV